MSLIGGKLTKFLHFIESCYKVIVISNEIKIFWYLKLSQFRECHVFWSLKLFDIKVIFDISVNLMVVWNRYDLQWVRTLR